MTNSLLFAFVVFDEMMDVIWPEPILWDWIVSLVS